MNTPVFDFIRKYSDSDISRLHMPGHKGSGFLGIEKYDITEIKGADSLYEADGIIRESEKNAASVFGSGDTFYSAEGSSLCIRTMIYASYIKRDKGKRPVIAAVRNVHKSFVFACALVGVDIEWIYPENRDSLCGGCVTAGEVRDVLKKSNPFALYITSPDYLGEISDIKGISSLCDEYNIPLIVDNAHGAYLRFTGQHPINNGAAMCCDSAHKTLPVLTGGAYLHISEKYKEKYSGCIKNAMSVFGSTSPSYLIMASLDLCNLYMSCGYEKKLHDLIDKINDLKLFVKEKGFEVFGDEPAKLTVRTDGFYIVEMLRKYGAECEYCDMSYVVLMFTPENTEEDFEKIKRVFSLSERKSFENSPLIPEGRKVMSVREALILPQESVRVESAKGRVCASPTVSCPPAVPIVVSGELITDEVIRVMKYYKIENVNCVERDYEKNSK